MVLMMNKKAMMMKLALLVFLLSFTSTMVDARFDRASFITQLLSNGEANTKSTTTACCDFCPCTRSIPPQCQCTDVKEKCHSACKSCLCTRSFPPQCRCYDITNFCYPSCS
ncbi:putative proteinase inhibitor I12, Bowman-Birk [Medicago truncatula]|uniref:Bowman birk trypsin inhibitor n=1 Tax=Medicago truncatula TaxID=3880 RepID=A0A072U1U8_MEDTR|nr:Bowman birk trypsin inhibitor [Medicago truncatula]RHN46931.1 putative proteinase inhibitor I12, Bowman-Birk [Medicago truncatula]